MTGHGVSSRSSHSCATGRTTFSAKSCTHFWSWIWSSLRSREKSGIWHPLLPGSYPRVTIPGGPLNPALSGVRMLVRVVLAVPAVEDRTAQHRHARADAEGDARPRAMPTADRFDDLVRHVLGAVTRARLGRARWRVRCDAEHQRHDDGCQVEQSHPYARRGETLHHQQG